METDRKTRIIKTAVKRFARHGLNKTTLDEIARDLRIGKSTIYHYFESKEALFYQTLEYDASLYINDIKQIFNNEQITFKERILEYLFYKQEIYNKYKLLYDLIIRVLNEECIESEKEILKKLLLEEENLLTIVLNNFYGSRIKLMNQGTPEFFVMQSWGILFSKKLNDLRENGSTDNYKELTVTNLNNVIT